MAAIRTIPAAAQLAGVSVSTIKKGLKQKFIIRKNGVFNPTQLFEGLQAQASRRGGRQLSDLGGVSPAIIALREAQAKEDLLLTKAKRTLAERNLGLDDGSLQDATELFSYWNRLMITFKDALLRFPDEIAGLAAMQPPAKVAALVRQRLNELLHQLATEGEQVVFRSKEKT